MIAMTGFVLIVMALMSTYVLEDMDPEQDFFPWAWELVVLIFNSGVIILIAGLIYQVWGHFA